MKFPTRVAGLLVLALALPSCSTTGTGSGALAANHPKGTGPFDSRGNYVEDWADNPTKWERATSIPVSTPSRLIEPDPPLIARNEQPPMNAIPISTTVSTVRPSPAPKPVASAAAKPVVAAAKPKPKAAQTVSKPKPKATAAKKPTTVRYTIRSGDSLSKIASRNGTTVSALQKANNIKGSLIMPGKVLVIPK
jgi:LysM repeat protein